MEAQDLNGFWCTVIYLAEIPLGAIIPFLCAGCSLAGAPKWVNFGAWGISPLIGFRLTVAAGLGMFPSGGGGGGIGAGGIRAGTPTSCTSRGCRPLPSKTLVRGRICRLVWDIPDDNFRNRDFPSASSASKAFWICGQNIIVTKQVLYLWRKDTKCRSG